MGIDRNAISNGLVGHWTFDGVDMTASTAYDRSGNGNTGTLTNNPTPVLGTMNQALKFDGSDDYVEAPNSASLNLSGSSGITISSWVYLISSPSTSKGIVGLWDNGSDRQWSHEVDSISGVLYAGLSVSSDGILRASRRGDTILNQNTWYHIVTTWRSNATMEIYVNGALQTLTDVSSTESIPTSLNSSTRTVCTGLKNNASANNCTTNTQPFGGLIDDVRIYNRALSQGVITRLYNIGAASKISTTRKDALSSGLVGHWTFDGQDMAGERAYDRSGQGNTGLLTSGPTRTLGRIGQALSFDGSDDFVDIFNSQTVPSTFQTIGNANNYSLSAWIKTSKAANGDEGFWFCESTIIELRDEDANTNTPFSFGIEDTFLCLGRSVSDAEARFLGTIAINDGRWHHVAISVNGVTAVAGFYLDGVFDVARSLTAGSNVSVGTQTSNMQIGVRSRDGGQRDENLFDGLIDDVRIYSRALSPAEITRLYNMGW